MNKRIILGIGSAAAVLVLGAAAVISGFGVTQRTDIEYMTDGPTFADITDLTNASKAVAHVRILSIGASYTIPFDNAGPVVTARPSGNPEKDKNGALNSSIPAGAAPTGVLKTDVTVEVLDNVRGAGLNRGDHIVVTQLGGTVSTRRPDGVLVNTVVASAEHDPLMQVGDEEVMFLNRDANSGKFFTTGGGLGRFKVQTNGTLAAVDHGSAIAKIADGKPAAFLKNAARAVN
jgi:hypothetical protein